MRCFTRIPRNPIVKGGKARIRVTADRIVRHIGAGSTPNELLADFLYLQRKDIAEALRYAGCLDISGLDRPSPA